MEKCIDCIGNELFGSHHRFRNGRSEHIISPIRRGGITEGLLSGSSLLLVLLLALKCALIYHRLPKRWLHSGSNPFPPLLVWVFKWPIVWQEITTPALRSPFHSPFIQKRIVPKGDTNRADREDRIGEQNNNIRVYLVVTQLQ